MNTLVFIRDVFIPALRDAPLYPKFFFGVVVATPLLFGAIILGVLLYATFVRHEDI